MSRLTLRHTTALAAAFATVTGTAPVRAQGFSDLNGIFVPYCADNGGGVDAGSLGPEAFQGGNAISPDQVLANGDSGRLCLAGTGRVVLREAEAQVEPAPEQPAPSAETIAEELPAPEPEQPVETTAPVAEIPEGDDVGESRAEGEATAPTAPVAEIPAGDDVGEGREVNTPPPSENMALSDGNDASDVEETTVTDENSRSSDEDFADDAGNESRRGGLSTFEKFALGAAGAVVVGSILNNREVVSNSGDRVVVRRDDGTLDVLRDDDTLLRRPGSEVRTESFADGSTRTTVTRPDGSRIVTIADSTGRVLKRTRITPEGDEFVLIDDTEEVEPVNITELPAAPAPRRLDLSNDREALRAALEAEAARNVNRTFTLRQIREFKQVRSLMPEINFDSINFATGSAAITSDEAEELFDLGQAMSEFIAENPGELFLIEGHTDAVGNAASNLTLSDRRAESVALALTEYFDVPPENMIIQGYGESDLAIQTEAAERANRRAAVRRITPLLR